MAKPRRFKWRGPADYYEPKERVGRDLFDAGLPLGDIPKEKKPAAAGARVIFPSKPLGCECGRGEFIQLGARWVCVNCNPQPQHPTRTAAREIVTIPAALANDAAELRKAWELIQQKRAAAGLAPLAEICEPTQPEPQPKAKQHKTHFTRGGMKLPKTAAIWPLMGVHSWDTKHGGAWRLTVLFSALDHNDNCNHAADICSGGSGKIERATLENAALALGVKRSTFYSWLADAKAWGIFAGDGKFLYMASQEKLAKIFLCNDIDSHKAIIPIKLLFKAGWKNIVWAAYTKANHNKKLITENKLEGITGVPKRTQQRLNTHVKRIKNIAITKIDGTSTNLQAAKENSPHKGYFVFNRNVAYALPARRSVNDTHAKIGARGRRLAILKSIKSDEVYGLFNNGNYPPLSERPQQATNGETITRLFNETKKHIKKAGRLLQAQQRAKSDPHEVYIIRPRKYRVGAWDVCPLGEGITA